MANKLPENSVSSDIFVIGDTVLFRYDEDTIVAARINPHPLLGGISSDVRRIDLAYPSCEPKED